MDALLDSLTPLTRHFPFLAKLQHEFPVLFLLGLATISFAVAFFIRQLGAAPRPPPPSFLKVGWQPLALSRKVRLNHNTILFSFDLPLGPRQPLGLPIGKHIRLRALDASGSPLKDAEGAQISRSYTPTTPPHVDGTVDFVIKVYPQGKMTQFLDKLEVGGNVDFYGPIGRFTYTPNAYQHLGMVAGGTGITPMYQVMQAILHDPTDTTRVSLVFGNVTEEDILLRTELEDMAKKHPDRIKLHFLLDKPDPKWTGGKGFVTPAVLSAHLPAPGPGVMVLRCGPPPMVASVKKGLDGLKYTDEMQFEF